VVIKKSSTRGISTRGTSSVRGTYIRASKRLKNACVRLHRLDGAGDLNDAFLLSGHLRG